MEAPSPWKRRPRRFISLLATEGGPPFEARYRLMGVLLLAAAVIAAYWPALHGGFIFDDDAFLTGNRLIQDPHGWLRFWTTRDASDYWPVTSTSLWLEWRLWGMNAAGYHATNVLLHLADVALLGGALVRLRIPGAGWAAAIFALHPINAETVSWITERKNLLALLFVLLSLHAYLRAGGWRWYAASLAAFVLAMLSKTSVVALPLLLFALPPPRWRVVPFLAIGGLLAWWQSGFSTVLAPGIAPAMGTVGHALRAGAVTVFYLGKAVWPAGLAFDYGPWSVQPGLGWWWLPLLGVVAVSAVLWRYRRGWARGPLLGWAAFLAALLPVMGFAEVGFMKYSPVSDHFAHLAMLAVAAVAGMGLAKLPRVAGFGVLAVLAVLTWRQSRDYASAESLYRSALAHNPRSWLAHTNLGVILIERHDHDAGLRELEAAIDANPKFPDAHDNLGVAYYRFGRLADAIREYETALDLRPNYPQAHNNLGVAFAVARRYPEAVHQFQEALRLDPDYAEAQENLTRAEALAK